MTYDPNLPAKDPSASPYAPVPPSPSGSAVTPYAGGPAPYGTQNPYAAQGNPYGQPAETNPLALTAMICGLVGLVFPIAALGGIIFGHIGLSQTKRTGQAGRGFALTGLISGYVVTALWVLGWLVYFLFIVLILGVGASAASTS